MGKQGEPTKLNRFFADGLPLLGEILSSVALIPANRMLGVVPSCISPDSRF